MNNPKLYSFLENYVERFPQKNIFFNKTNKQWIGYSSADIFNKTLQVAASLMRLGFGGRKENGEEADKISIISSNRTEWVIADYACQQLGIVLVPLYPTLHPDEMKYVMNDAGIKAIFVDDKSMYKKVAVAMADVPSLKQIFSFETIEGVQHFSELLVPFSESELQSITAIKHQIKDTDLTTIIYTSGTTGNPKGVMLSHRNIASNVINCVPLFTMCGEDGKALSFLPLNHIFEKMVMSIYVAKGITVYFAEGMETIGDNLREVKPDLFTTVPRLLEKVYEKIEAKGAELKGMKKNIFDWALSLAEKFELHTNQGFIYNTQRKIADKLVYSKWREAVGGNVKAIITGSAACQLRLQKIFTCANLIVMEGYGLTETSPVVTVNTFEEAGRAFGTIGVPIKGQEVKLAEDGEIICRGDHIMMGYYKQPQLTAESIKDGWFHTGDIGTWVNNTYLKITDRKKELFKLSAGKYIAPQLLENKMKESQYIEQIMVVGNNEKFVGALIVPSIKNIVDYFKSQGKLLEGSNDILINDEDVQKLIRTELNNYNKHFSSYEAVKRFQLLPEEWTINTGELTPTLKLKRKVIAEKYKSLIEKIFVGA